MKDGPSGDIGSEAVVSLMPLLCPAALYCENADAAEETVLVRLGANGLE